jgi:hypothetical protein
MLDYSDGMGIPGDSIHNRWTFKTLHLEQAFLDYGLGNVDCVLWQFGKTDSWDPFNPPYPEGPQPPGYIDTVPLDELYREVYGFVVVEGYLEDGIYAALATSPEEDDYFLLITDEDRDAFESEDGSEDGRPFDAEDLRDFSVPIASPYSDGIVSISKTIDDELTGAAEDTSWKYLGALGSPLGCPASGPLGGVAHLAPALDDEIPFPGLVSVVEELSDWEDWDGTPITRYARFDLPSSLQAEHYDTSRVTWEDVPDVVLNPPPNKPRGGWYPSASDNTTTQYAVSSLFTGGGTCGPGIDKMLWPPLWYAALTGEIDPPATLPI